MMGEIADMMLDGTCCQVCGEFMDEEAAGYPVTCEGCGGNEWESHSGGNDYKLAQKDGEKQIDYIQRLKNAGYVNRQIAAMLGLSIGSLKKKLKIHNKSSRTD